MFSGRGRKFQRYKDDGEGATSVTGEADREKRECGRGEVAGYAVEYVGMRASTTY